MVRSRSKSPKRGVERVSKKFENDSSVSSQQGPIWKRISESCQKIEDRIDALDAKIAENGEKLRRYEKYAQQQMLEQPTTGDLCGVVSISNKNAVLEVTVGESTQPDSRQKSAYGNMLYMYFCISYVLFLIIACFDVFPVFDFEILSMEEWVATRDWTANNFHVAIGICVLYFVSIFLIQDSLRDKQPYDLRYPLAIWSALLATFSVLGSLRTVPALIYTIYDRGLDHFLCGDSRFDWLLVNPAGYWTYYFILSKIPELIDTFFIVLRKKPLITLHWWHHITVALFCFHSWATVCLNGLIFSAMNLTVHGFMYTFYTMAALGYRPTKFAQSITMIQIAQMMVGTAVTLYVVWRNRNEAISLSFEMSWDMTSPTQIQDGKCKVHTMNGIAGLLMYGSYLYLFVMFFYYSYIKRRR